MKFISWITGNAALHFSPDDVTPLNGVMARYLIDFVVDLYHFAVKPTIPDGIAPAALPYFVFQSGLLEKDNEPLPIQQLVYFPNGGFMISARNTDVADAILTHLVSELDNKLNYRFQSARQRRSYQSAIVVQFNPPLEKQVDLLSRLEDSLEALIRREGKPFKTKRIAFGYGDVSAATLPITIDTIEDGDFVIERRSGEPYSENRYFCSAPVSSSQHLQILEAIEKVIAARA